MFRTRSKYFGQLLYSIRLNQTNQRQFSSQKLTKGKATFILGSGAILASALTLSYAKYDKEFANQLITFAPFLKDLIEEKQSPVNDIAPFTKKKVEKPFEAKKVLPLNAEKDAPPKIEPKSEIKIEEPIKLESEKKTKFDFDEETLKKELNLETKDTQQELERQYRGQLKRLLYAFNEFYEEKRILFEAENKKQQEIEFNNRLIQERAAVADEYEKSFKKLKQMEHLLQIRDQLDKQEKASKKLWILSQTLSKLLEHDKSIKAKPKPIEIEDKLKCVREIVKDNFANDKLIQMALDTLSKDAIQNGVYSEEDLIRRFYNLETICNRVALIDNNYTNIFGYLKSYAYSFIRPFLQYDIDFSMNPIKLKRISQDELDGKLEVNPSEWDIYDILQRIKLCIEQRNLEMALRYANLLNGEAGKLARDWIKDTREHLEVKQVFDLIQTKIASINLYQLSFTV